MNSVNRAGASGGRKRLAPGRMWTRSVPGVTRGGAKRITCGRTGPQPGRIWPTREHPPATSCPGCRFSLTHPVLAGVQLVHHRPLLGSPSGESGLLQGAGCRSPGEPFLVSAARDQEPALAGGRASGWDRPQVRPGPAMIQPSRPTGKPRPASGRQGLASGRKRLPARRENWGVGVCGH